MIVHSLLQSFGKNFSHLLLLLALFATGVARAADHVVVVVFDGMRPDFITPQYAPNLYGLATNGVFFRRNHCVYVSTTIVNGTAIATGMYPGHSGILANSDFHPELNSQSAIGSEALDTVRRGDLLSNGQYIAVDTVAELIQDAGFHTYVAGTKAVALMHDRSPRRTDTAAHSNSVTLFRGLTLPRAGLDPLVKANDDKAFPDAFTSPNVASDGWTTKALTRGLWKKGVPKYSLLWLSDPDVTQHAKGVGAPEALSAIEASDKNLGEVIKVLKDKGVYDRTDILVVSDHGFSTILRGVDVAEALRRRGLNAHSKFDNPEPGDVLVTGLGGSALIHVIGQREDVIRKTVEALQTSDFTGVIFSRLEIEGTFPMNAIRYPGTTNAPDLVVSMRWDPTLSDTGAPGMLIATGGSRNAGTHGSLSRYDMNNTLVASGPDFKKGFLSDTPSGNIDVAPTVLYLLGIKPREPMDGRVLREALVSNTGPLPEVKEQKLEASRRSGFMQWNQYLKTLEVDGAMYFDEGNGAAVLK
ncbi:MAG TPA: alkaline phosphatase family protein [Verrucomicrobiota bacterium]|nr:alkaline phosphatase family protein [Verrucomicrobiota bacterium]